MRQQAENVEAIFMSALSQATPEQRAAYVEQACAGDATLLARVRELLSCHEASYGPLDAAPANALRTVEQHAPVERPGTIIGPFKLLQQIGEGGFGVVFMAEQTEPVRRKVALKILKAGMDTKQVIARFEAERQALALMDHPHIAHVYDGGATESGRPYFVMELVKGIPITEYCDAKKLDTRERLQLFLQVCQAVQHAHQKGIIHRDIKPSNVLVTPHDGVPLVKVIDFGIAKAMSGQLTEKTIFTAFAQMIGTPMYMSPEQAEVNALDVDTRSDVYSLGVLLYELLTGTTPFDKETLNKAGFDEIRRIIREDEPQRPSNRISTLQAQQLSTVSDKRKIDPRKLSHDLRGELDWIVMKSLEKDRNRRYESPKDFAADVQRYLSDEPVQARPASAWYRLKKFARRNKTGLAVAGLVLLFVVSLGGIIGWAMRDRDARAAEIAQDRLNRQRRLATEVELLLKEVEQLEGEQKWPEAMAAAKRAEAALVAGEADETTRQRIAELLKDLKFIDRLDQIRMERATIMVKGAFDFAGTDRKYARAFREYGVDVDRLPVKESVTRLKARPAAFVIPLAAALDDWFHARTRHSEKDEPAWRRLVAVARGIDPDPLRDPLRAAWGKPPEEVQGELKQLADRVDVSKQHRATLLVLAISLRNAKLLHREIEFLHQAQYAHPGDFWLTYELGVALVTQKDYEEALQFCTAAVSIRPKSADAHNNLGGAFANLKKFDKAIAHYKKAIALDPTSAAAHTNLGKVFANQKKWDMAIACYQRAIDSDPEHAAHYNNLGDAFHKQQKLDDAIPCYQKAITLDPKLAVAHYNLGLVFHDQKKLDKAVFYYKKAITLDPQFAPTYLNLGAAFADLKKWEMAITYYKKAIEFDRKNAKAYSNLGDVFYYLKKLDTAIDHFKKAIKYNPKIAQIHNNLGVVFRDLKKMDEAIACFKKAIELDPKYVLARNNLRNAFLKHKRLDEAIAYYQKAIKTNPGIAAFRADLGQVYLDHQKLDEAATCYKKAIELDPKSGFYRSLGNLFLRQQQLGKAIDCYKKATKVEPRNAGLWGSLGNLFRSQGKLDEAIACHKKATELNPREPAHRRNLGRCVVERLRLLFAAGRFDDAASLFLRAIETDPNFVLSHRKEVAALDKHAKWDDSIASYRKAIKVNSKSAGRHFALGYALSKKGRRDEALKCFKSAVEIDPKLSVGQLYLALSLAGKETLPETIDRYQRALTLEPNNAGLHGDLGRIYLDHQKLDEAAACYKKATEVEPKNAGLWGSLGNLFRSQGKLDEAIACYKKVVALDPKKAALHWNLGNVLLQRNKLDDAVASFQNAIALNSRAPWPHTCLGIALEKQGKLNEAITHYQKAIVLNSKIDLPRSNLLRLLLKAGRFDQATSCFLKIIELRPNFVLAHNLDEHVKWDDAIAFYRKAVKSNPKSVGCRFLLGFALSEKGLWDEAIPCFRKAVELDPNLVIGQRNLVGALVGKGALREAIDCDAESVKRWPGDRWFYDNLSWTLATAGDDKLRDAREAIGRAIRAMESDPNKEWFGYWYALGVAHYRHGDWKAAVEALSHPVPVEKRGWHVWSRFFLAMAESRLGNRAAAERRYKTAVAALQGGNDGPELLRLRDEAAALLKIDNKTKRK